MDSSYDGSQIWWRADDANDRARRVLAVCDNLESRLAGRIDNALRNIELYEGRKLGSLSASAYASANMLLPIGSMSGTPCDVKMNLARSLVNTAVSQVAAKQRPLSQFVTNGADWETKRKAKRLEKFCQAVKLQRQGPFLGDFWAVGLRAFVDQGVGDSMWIKFWADWTTKQVRAGRVPWWQILVDPTEAANGEPLSLFHVYPYSKEKLAAEHPEHEDAIMAAPAISVQENSRGIYGSDVEAGRMIKVRDAYRLAFSDEEPGMRSLVVGGGDGGVDLLALEGGKAKPWKRTFFPVETSSWEPHLQGIFGTSIVDTVRGLCTELNESIQRRAEAERTCSNMHIAFEENSIDEEMLEDNRIGVRLPYKKGFAAPKFEVPNSTSQGSIDWANKLIAWAHDVTGISEQAAQAVKQPGIESKVAIVEVENIQSDRLGVQIQNYERIMSVGADRQIVACMRELAEEVGDDELVVKWPGGAYFKELKWSKCSLEDNQFTIQPMGVGGLSITPAARKEVGVDLLDRGLITGDQYKAILQFNDPQGELEKGNAIMFWCDESIETWLDVDEDDIDDPKKFRYKGPLPLMFGLQAQTDALVRVGNAYLLQDADGCPPWRLEFFLRFIDQTGLQINKLQARQAELAGAAHGNTAAVQQIAQPVGQGQ